MNTKCTVGTQAMMSCTLGSVFVAVGSWGFVCDGKSIVVGVCIMDMAIIDGALKLFMLAGVIRLIK